MPRLINPVPQFFDSAGDPLAFGTLTIYSTGTSDFLDLFTDVNLSIPIDNPVDLSADGRAPNIFFVGAARVILKNQGENQIWERESVSSDQLAGAFSNWNSLTVYSINNIVQYTDGLFYISITNDNQGNIPSSSPVNWSQIKFIRVYNANETYVIDAVAQASNGLLFRSRTNGNIGNDPLVDAVNWEPAATVFSDVYDSPSYWAGNI